MAEPNRSGGGNQQGVAESDEIAGIGPRRAGSDAERRTARLLTERLRALGREAETEPLRARPAFALTHFIHAVLGVVGSVVAVYSPLLGFAIVALATVSAFGELTGAFALIRLLTPARASQNVISDEDGDKPGLIVLVAHYDAPRAGALSERRLKPIWPRALFWSLVVILVCSLVRIIGIDASWLTVIQFIATVVLIALSPFLVDSAISSARDDPADNLAGVTTVLRLAERLGRRLEHFDLMVLFTGASAEFGLGMRAWLKRHRKELDREATAIISIDHLPEDQPARVAEKEGPVFRSRLHPTLIDLAGDDAEVFISREFSDAAAARAAGLPALRISGGQDVEAFAADLIRRIDSEIGPRLA
jgi:hypothetical protein